MERTHEDYANDRPVSGRRVVMTEEDFCTALRQFGVPLPADTQVVKVRVSSPYDHRVHLVVESQAFPPLDSNPMTIPNMPALLWQQGVSHDPAPIPETYASDRPVSGRRVTMTEEDFCTALRQFGVPLPVGTHVRNFRERNALGDEKVHVLVASRAFPAPVNHPQGFREVPELLWQPSTKRR